MVRLFRYLSVFCTLCLADLSLADPPTNLYHFAIVSPAAPSRLHMIWEPFRDYLSRETRSDIELVFPKGIDQVETVIDNQQADFIFLNSYIYYLLKEKGKLVPIAQTINLDGDPTSRGSFIVRTDSGIRNVEQLRGRKLSAISPLGAGAYLAPRAYLRAHDIDIDADLDLEFTGDLKRSVYAVLLGDADVATMCGVNFKILEHKLDLRELTIIDNTNPFPETLIAAHVDLDDNAIQRIRAGILKAATSPEGQQALEPLGDIKILRFDAYDPSIETMTENLLD